MAKIFDIEVITIPKNKAGTDAKAPAVYLNDKVLAVIGGLRDGKITEEELITELSNANVPKRQSQGGCECSCT